MIELTQGDLLKAPVEALVNTVNTVGVMGKGIALQFKQAFPDNYKAYKKACAQGRVRIGEMFVHEVGGLTLPRYLINFPTKEHWRDPSRMEYVRAGLPALVQTIRELHIQSVAVPPLGCGNGGLEWSDVRPLIEEALRPLAEVRVLVFEPGAAAARELPVRTPRPEMTMGRAAILALMHRYHVPGYDYPLSLLEVQKLAYFLQEAGHPLKLKYQAHIYGPYADNLRHVLQHIEGHFIRGFGDGRNKPETPIELLPGAAEEAERFLVSDRETEARFDRVARLIEGFETPFGMELLSSVLWVCRVDAGSAADPATAVQQVHAWSPRKASMMLPEQIRSAWDQLRRERWI